MSPALAASRGTALAPRIELDGSLLPETWLMALAHLRVELGVGMIGRATARFTDVGYDLATAGLARIGTALRIRAEGVSDTERVNDVFVGTVTAIGMELAARGNPELVVVAHDRAYELARGTTVGALADATLSDVVKKIAWAGGLAADVSGTPTKMWAYLPQADTDLGLLDELTRRAGLDWVVRDTELVVWRSWTASGRTTGASGTPTVSLSPNADLHEFSVMVTGDAPTEVRVSGWDPVDQKELKATTRPGRGGVPATLASTVGLSKAKPATVRRAAESPESEEETTALAAAHGRAGSVVLRGRSSVQPRLRPGGLVKLEDVGPASGEYFVQAVEHVFTTAGFDTRFVAGDRARSAPVTGGRPEPSSLRRTALAVGVVTNVSDKQPLGRVKVKFPGLDMQVESGWARVAYPGAGKGDKAARGALWLPEVGDQVLVGFEDGDTRHPVIVGGLLGKDAGFPADLRTDSNVKVRRLASHTGARLDLGDGSGDAEQYVLLTLDGGQHKLRIGKDKAELAMPNGKPLEITVGSTAIKLDGNGAITLKATDITLDATGAVTIKGASVAVEAAGSTAVKGVTVNVKASATGTVEAGGSLALKGAIVQVN